MRNNGFFVFATCCLLVFSATSCQKIKGIFGKKKSFDTILCAGDRIEIYRPLAATPQELRRRRLQNNRKP